MSKHPPQILTTSAQPPPSLPVSQATKRASDGDNEDTVLSDKDLIKRSKKRRLHQEDQQKLDLDHGVNVDIAKMDTHLLANYVAQHTKRFHVEFSSVELEDLHLPESAFQDSSDWTKPRLLEYLPKFLDHYSSLSGISKNLATASKKPGAPHTLVIVSAGLRAANVARALRIFQTKDAAVAKLFAKHIKLKDAINYVKKTRIGIGAGTPSRILDLFNAGALCFENLERLVVDCSHIDLKKRCIFDMRETQRPLIQLLNLDELRSRYHGSSNSINILFF